MFHIPTSLAK